MRPVLTPAEMAEADGRAIAGGTPEAVLVERAGRAVAWSVRRALGGRYGRRAVVVAGKGNNGADGRVAARVLRGWGIGVDEFMLDAGIDRGSYERSLGRADVVVDAMFGTGFRGVLEGDAAWIAARSADHPLTVAVDIPSGVDGLTGEARGVAVRADRTVCFAALKPGLLFEPGKSLAGTVEIADVGIDPGATLLGVPDVLDLWLPARLPNAHKWSAAVLVVGGSAGMEGAPLMAARAAARCGAGMVVCAMPTSDTAAATAAAEVVILSLPATPEGALDVDGARVAMKEISRFHALAVGPGLGRDDRTQAAVRRLVAEAAVPVVIDADGLNALAVDPAPLRVRHAGGLPRAVLTPHEREYERLAGRPVGADRVEAARFLAERTRCVVLLKGPGTVVAEPGGRASVNPTGSSALATAGTGDVLTGIIGGIVASGAPPFEAAVTGAYVHGLAAMRAPGGAILVATDLLDALPPTLGSLAHCDPEV